MAEGITIFCRDVTWTQLSDWLDERWPESRLPGTLHWQMPLPDYSISVYDAGASMHSYDPSDRQEITRVLGGAPDLGMIVELRRSVQDEACDMTTELTFAIMSTFPSVADDEAGKLWTRKDIERCRSNTGARFLDTYRSEPAEPSGAPEPPLTRDPKA